MLFNCQIDNIFLEFSGKTRESLHFNRRVHHSGVGALLGLRSLFSKSQPIPSEILSGLGKL